MKPKESLKACWRRTVDLCVRVWVFFTKDLWRPDTGQLQGLRYHLQNVVRILVLATRGFQNNKLIIIASALTYFSLLAFIPLMTIILGIAKGFGLENYLQGMLLEAFPGHIDVFNFVFNLVEQALSVAANGVVIGIGLVFIIWSVWAIVNNLERAFNMVWNIPRGRKFYRKLSSLLAAMFVIPILLVITCGLSIYIRTTIHSSPVWDTISPLVNFLVKLLPYLLSWIVFTLLYVIAPNTKVKFKNAVLAGLLAGLAFQAFQYLYINGQLWVARYNALYGSFAALPLLFLWLQLTWIVVLFGAEITFANQNIRNYFYEKETQAISLRYQDFFTMVIMSAVCKGFEQGERPMAADEISLRYHIPIRLAISQLEHLKQAGMLSVVTDEKNERIVYYQPALDINQITMGRVYRAIHETGAENFNIDTDHQYREVWQAVCCVESAMVSRGDDFLLKDLSLDGLAPDPEARG